MSQNFERVKRDILKDMKELSYISGDAWADILLKHSKYCESDADQISFWNFILNPSDSRDFETPKYITSPEILEMTYTPQNVVSNKVKLENEYHQEGGTVFMKTIPVEPEYTQDDEKESESIPEECKSEV